jgi:2-polyprenyl-3-methyl-5-hydroxy-6-metoxy-1,4-benzoquinol methylase
MRKMSDPQAWLDRARAQWDERAPNWDQMSEANRVAPDRGPDLARVLDALGVQPGDRLLDAGCGTGQYATAFARMGYRMTAIDLSPEMIGRAIAHGRELGVEVGWHVGPVSEIPAPDGMFDAIHARVVLQFVPDPVAVLNEFRRVLKPGGRLFVSVPGALSPIYNRSFRRFLDAELTGANYIVPWELEQLLQELGWRVLTGWGDFSTNLSGDPNPLGRDAVSGLDIRLQQAAATIWAFVAAAE